MNIKSFISLVLSQLLVTTFLFAQSGSISGYIMDEVNSEPIPNVTVHILSLQINTATDADGYFIFEDLDNGTYLLQTEINGYLPEYRTLVIRDNNQIDLGFILLENDDSNLQSSFGNDAFEFSTVTGDDLVELDDKGVQNNSALLSASQDLFLSAASFNFSAFRFDVRGLESRHNELVLNGVNMNDPASGNVYWSLWGGLNDMFRFRQVEMGMGATEYAMGSLNGASTIDLRPSQQRNQTSVSYALSNRSYRNRIMVSHTTGLSKKGWALSLSASRRWAQEGYTEGTPYDAYAYFVGIEKVFNKSHSLGLTVLGAPRLLGKSSPSVQEAKDLTGNNFYNSYWGYQNGEKRNARMTHTHQPIAILRYDYTPDRNTQLRVSAFGMTGTNGSTALDWFDKASDPRPDYYRKLPSFVDNPETARLMTEAWKNDPNVSQIDWHKLYEINSLSQMTVENANGTGESYSGKFARYLVEDRRFDGTQLGFNAVFNKILKNNMRWTAGVNYNYSLDHNYKIAKDLLGADFYLNVDKFALRDSSNNEVFIQNNLDVPNEIIKEGDKFGYEYNTVVHRAQAWSQLQYYIGNFALHGSAAFTSTRFWREGIMRNGKFPDNSFGKSAVSSFPDYKVKAGIQYAFDGRNFLFANGMIGTEAPYLRNSFTSIRTRDQLIPGLTQQKIMGGEIAYILRAPSVKMKLAAYAIQFKDQSETRSFYLDEDGRVGFENIVSRGFVNLTMTGINKRHMGLEAAVDVQIVPGLSVKGAAAVGEYIYTSRPNVSAILDNDETFLIKDETAYLKGFYVSGTPQTAFNVGLSYNAPNYWFVNVNWNYYNNTFLDINPLRRTALAVRGAEPGSALWNDIIKQEKAPGGFTIDVFGGKSYRYKGNFISILGGISNLLNNKNLITGGYEQYRYRLVEDPYSESPNPNEFPRNYFYAYGLNYYISLSLRI